MYEMYINTNGLLREKKARRISGLLPPYEIMVVILRLINDDLDRVKRIIAILSRELGEEDSH